MKIPPFSQMLTLELWIGTFLTFTLLTYLFQGFHLLESIAGGLAVSSVYVTGRTLFIFMLRFAHKKKTSYVVEEISNKK